MSLSWQRFLSRVRQEAEQEAVQDSVEAGRLRLIARAIEREDLTGARQMLRHVSPELRGRLGEPPEAEDGDGPPPAGPP